MIQEAKIQVQRHVDGLGGWLNTYHWEGDRHATAFISAPLVRDLWPTATVGAVVTLGDLRLRVMDYTIFNQLYSVRLDGWRARIVVRWSRLGNLLRLTYARSLLTLAVWQLAEIPQGDIPSWRHIKALKRWAR